MPTHYEMSVRQEEVAGQPHEVSVLVGMLFVNACIVAKIERRRWHFFRLPDVQVSEYMQKTEKMKGAKNGHDPGPGCCRRF